MKLSVNGNEEFTVRVSEKMTDTKAVGFTWETPVKTAWECVTFENTNLGDFQTGYNQWLFKTLEKDVECTEDVELTKKDGSGVDKFTFVVKRAKCPDATCEAGKIQNLDVDSCEC